MSSLQEELSKSLYLYTSGSSIEAVREEDGVTRARVVEPEPGAGVAAEDQTNPFAIAGEVEPMSVGEFAEKTGEMAAGALGGSAAVTAGFPGDILGIAEGLYGSVTAEEGERLDAFLQNLASRSEQMGSAFTIGTLENLISKSDLSPETKKNMLAGSKYLGEWVELPGGIAAASALMRGARSYAAGAPARVAERGTGTTLQSGVDPMAAVDEAIVAAGKVFNPKQEKTFYVNVREDDQVRAQAQEQVQAISQQRGNRKPKIEDLADYFEQQHQQIYGRKLDPNNDTDFSQAVSSAADEIRYQLDQAVSGKGWYDADIKKTFETLSKVPGLEKLADNEDLRVLWSAMAAPTSIGNAVSLNTKAATAAFLRYLRTGEVPTTPPEKGAVTEGIPGAGWGMKGKSVAAGMKVIDHLVKTKGVEGFADWWLSPHTLKELTEIRKAAGLSGAPTGLSGGQNSMHLGAMVLGDKTGRYSLNINGYQGTTKDIWFSRSYNRHFGNMKNPDGSVAGGPRNLSERRRMEEFVANVVEELQDQGLSEQDAQAVLWFYEQNLFTDLGVQSRPGSFSQASEGILNELRPGVRGSDEAQVRGEPESQGLADFRGVGAKQRTVRAGRRGGPAGAGDSQDIGAPPSPYTRSSAEGDEGDGLLVFDPDPVSKQKYEAAGLSVPSIKEVPATDAVAYNQDMTQAMAGRADAAQVEIKSADELAEARLFRTENGSGFAIKPDGDIVAVFASKTEPSGGGYSMLQAAVEAGGRKLDAFDTYLPAIYETAGFRPVARVRWNDEFAPPNWNKADFAEFNNGEPDVILFVYDPNYFGTKVDVPSFDDFDEAARLQDAEVQKVQGMLGGDQ